MSQGLSSLQCRGQDQDVYCTHARTLHGNLADCALSKLRASGLQVPKCLHSNVQNAIDDPVPFASFL